MKRYDFLLVLVLFTCANQISYHPKVSLSGFPIVHISHVLVIVHFMYTNYVNIDFVMHKLKKVFQFFHAGHDFNNSNLKLTCTIFHKTRRTTPLKYIFMPESI